MDARPDIRPSSTTDLAANGPGTTDKNQNAWISRPLIRYLIWLGIIFNVAIIGYTMFPLTKSLMSL